MRRFELLILIFCVLSFEYSNGQTGNLITVAELGFDLPVGEYSLAEVSHYYAFESGDTLVADMVTSKFQGTNVLTISAYPSGKVIFSDDDFRKLINLRLYLDEKSVYRFSFATNAREPVHCDMKLSRIPETKEKKNFRTKVKWTTRKDTTYKIFKVTVLICQDTIVESILNIRQTINVRAVLGIQLPENTLSWYYWIGVGKEARDMYDKAILIAEPLVAEINSNIQKELSPFALYAYTEETILSTSNIGDNVKYWFFDEENKVEEFKTSGFFPYSDQGTVTADFGKMTYPLEGDYYIGLSNATTNKEYIDVTARVVVFRVINKYETKRDKRIHRVKTVKIPVIAK